MSRRPDGPDPDLLFDLPLDPVDDEPAAESLDEESFGSRGGGGYQSALTFAPDEEPPPEPLPTEAPLGPRFVAAALDGVVLLAVLGFALLSLRLLDIPIATRVIAPLALFLGAFSFLYQVVPLAFWGHTPGMAHAGVHSRSKSGDFMTMQQCILRWIGWTLTIATAGLVGLVALSGVSLSDLLSRTRSYTRV